MKIKCDECNRALGEIAGKLRTGDHAAKFICAICLAELRTSRERRGEDMFNTLFGGGLRR